MVEKIDRPKPPDLWNLAFERAELDERDRDILLQASKDHSETWSPVKFVEQVKELTRERSRECERSGWVDKASGRTAVAQQAEAVLTAVLELKEFVSAGLKFDVSGYGATAWSVVTFGLQVRCPLFEDGFYPRLTWRSSFKMT